MDDAVSVNQQVRRFADNDTTLRLRIAGELQLGALGRLIQNGPRPLFVDGCVEGFENGQQTQAAVGVQFAVDTFRARHCCFRIRHANGARAHTHTHTHRGTREVTLARHWTAQQDEKRPLKVDSATGDKAPSPVQRSAPTADATAFPQQPQRRGR